MPDPKPHEPGEPTLENMIHMAMGRIDPEHEGTMDKIRSKMQDLCVEAVYVRAVLRGETEITKDPSCKLGADRAKAIFNHVLDKWQKRALAKKASGDNRLINMFLASQLLYRDMLLACAEYMDDPTTPIYFDRKTNKPSPRDGNP